MIDRHFHWKFLAYNGEPEAEKMRWAVAVEVIGYDTEADAKIAAQAIVTRDQFGLVQVWECGSCGFQQATADSIRKIAEVA